jgi:hypothetical protein
MAKISNTLSYPNQLPIESGDYLIGTAANSSPIEKQTKTFTLGDIANFVIDEAFDGCSYRLPIFTGSSAGEESFKIVNSLFYQDVATNTVKDPCEAPSGTVVYLDNGSGIGSLSIAQDLTVGRNALIYGTTNLESLVYVNGGIYLKSEVYDSNSAIGTGEQVLVSQTDGTVEWQNYQGSGLEFQGAWNADLNSPDLFSIPLIPGNTGKYWVVSVAGATPLDTTGGGTITDWEVGDWAIISEDLNDNIFWDKIDNSSVLTGQGTPGNLAIWVTDSELGDAPVKAGVGNNSLIFNSLASNLADGEVANAMGNNTEASGDYSTAMGNDSNASGVASTAMGDNTIASGDYSTAIGGSTEASGDTSTAMGGDSKASGAASTAMGKGALAGGDYSTAMGRASTASGLTSTAMGDDTTASGAVSTAMGNDTTASGSISTAMGSDTKASGAVSTAMGSGTEASGDFSTAMGSDTKASGEWSTAMGDNTTASADYSTAMGASTIASGAFSTATGFYTVASGNFSTSMGFETVASGIHSTAMGDDTTASGLNSFTQGQGGSADGNNAAKFGYEGKAAGNNSVKFGYESIASGNYSITSGFQTQASGSSSVAMGSNNISSGDSSTSFGKQATASGDYSLASGFQVTATGAKAISLGNSTDATGSNSVAIGLSNQSVGDSSVAIGNGNVSSGKLSLSYGNSQEASGVSAIAIGGEINTASGDFSVSIGSGNDSAGTLTHVFGANNNAQSNKSTLIGDENTSFLSSSKSTAIGLSNALTGSFAYAFGSGLEVTDFRQTVLGSYNLPVGPGDVNTWNSSDNLFIIGNGESATLRSNALEIRKDGELKLNTYGFGNVTGTPTYFLAVDSSGKVVETTGGGGGSGVANLSIGNSSVNTTGVNTGITLNSNTGLITLTPKTFGGSNNVGLVPSSNSASQNTSFLRADGSWAVPSASGIGGSGTVNTLAMFTPNGTTIANSPITNPSLNDIELSGRLVLPIYGEFSFGSSTSDKFSINNNISGSTIKQIGSGTLDLSCESDVYIRSNSGGIGGEALAKFSVDGSIQLYYDNVLKFETTSNSVKILGVTVYADNTAALAGGLTVGEVYRTDDFLKIVH